MKGDVRARIRAIGAKLTPEMLAETAKLFAPRALRPSPQLCAIERDLAYGSNVRHKLDVFTPVIGGTHRPIFVYVHGGGFIRGDKGAPDAPFYNNVGAWAARQGFVGVTMTYRLAPKHSWPAGAEDIAAAVAWLRSNSHRYGGDATKIFLAGQSAGAVHVASYVAMSELHGNGPGIAGAIMLSGLYELTTLDHSPFERAYYGDDASRFHMQSSLAGMLASSIPCMFGIAEYDPTNFQQQAALLVQRWFAAKAEWPRMLFLPDANHMSSVLGIGEERDSLSLELRAFVRKFGA